VSIDPHPVSVDTMDLLPDVNVAPAPAPASPAPPDPLGAARGAVAPVQRAAGAVVWRRHKGRLLVALVHRPRYDDWSWPKGKLDDGEDWPVAAAREVHEETGLRVRLGQVLPPTSYPVLGPDGLKAVKEVRYWSAVVTGGDGRLEHEVDKVAWLTPQKALRRLTYEHDRRQLAALMVADEEHRLRTWPLLVVRHAKAIPRKQWSKADWRRPLDERGARQSEAMVALLRAYDVQRVITSSATRCILTVAPYAKATKAKIHSSAVFSEEGFEEHPLTAGKAFAHALGRGSATALCSHGPLLPHLLNDLAMLADPTLPKVQADLEEAARENLDKGEVLVAHLAGSRKQVRVVGVERHPPLR
jgi:8-oxo-(d)GTP phosphatase